MKHLFYFLLASTLVFTSCNKDDDGDTNDTSSNEASIIGTWKLASITDNGVPEVLDSCDLEDFYTYSSNGSGVNNYNYGDNCEISDTDNFTYTINGNMLTLNFGDGDSETAEITTLNESTLAYSYSFTEEGTTYLSVETYTKQ
ncbi:hypothetical protein ULMS_26000 [Patiriisocius marinistellae]|uniref:Lipocalin-like domain-containing protein n=1 Tax=Patiriisocius marinistellae TaxID=2494560 RepID=A0A5J4G0I7_9FLAO|nr:lipocalin family protein [Patiriisocius marinistellae]GEQ87092.1 hypothetical protein ULMS_26000 [Patiriisocius marinistellae]